MTSPSKTDAGPATPPDAPCRPETVPSRPAARLEEWLRARRGPVLGVLLVAGATLRLVHLVQTADGPVAHQHVWDQSDMNFFHGWAGAVAAGDWLTDRELHPVHHWHRVVAEQYFRERPERLEEIVRTAGGDPSVDPARVLWNRWYGGKRFHQEPLYPYLVALTYRLVGGPRCVVLWQTALGLANLLLMYILARRFFGHTAALAAGLIVLLYPPLLFYETLLLRTTLIVFVGLFLVYLIDRALTRGSLGRWTLVGAACGFAILVKTTFVLLLIAALALLAAQLRRRRVVLLGHAAVTCLAAALPLAPAVARNICVGTAPLGLSSVATVTFVLSGAADHRPERPSYFALEHAARILGESEGRFLPAARATLATHPSLASYAGQVATKFLWLWHWYERPSNSNFYYYRRHVPVLGMLPLSFVILGPLGVLGLLLAVRRRDRCWPLFCLVGTSLLPLVLFFLVSRYRMPLVAALVPFAGLAVAQLVEWSAARRWRPALAAVGLLAALVAWVGRPLPPEVPLVRPIDYMAPFWTYYEAEERRARMAGKPVEAARVVEASLQTLPEEAHAIGVDRPPRNDREARLATFCGDVHSWYAEALERAGRAEAARLQRRRAEELRQAVAASSAASGTSSLQTK